MIKSRKLKIVLFFCLLVFMAQQINAQDSMYTNSIGMKLVLIKPGSFVVGKFQPPYPKPPVTKNRDDEERGYNSAEYKLAEEMAKRDARQGFQFVIQQPFYIGQYEVTQEQWQKVMGSNPAVFQGNKMNDDSKLHPVENVSWKDAQKFIKKLNRMEGRKVKFRLPTEFEWEYAARAGVTDDIPWAQIRQQAQIGTRTTNVIGGKQPNAWGLYDMLGNVWEWVQDYYNEKIFADPIPPNRGRQHVLKGASFVGDVKNATYMTHAAGPGNGWDVGFRVVMEVQ
jgi:formylglycine-generating enzyme required for sulfatase activity